MIDDLEHMIDLAYVDHLKLNNKTQNKRKHPSRAEFGEIFKQTYLWILTIQEITKAENKKEVLNLGTENKISNPDL
ncbi:MAG: hypothetical protein WC998_06440 [Candidatus Paceibacterota bacterium]|jgi:hypothetical protein